MMQVPWNSFLSASLMMALAGIVALLVLRRTPVESWRLRSWLIAAVLLQGLMVFRSPVHLGLIEAAPSPTIGQSRLDVSGPMFVTESLSIDRDPDSGASLVAPTALIGDEGGKVAPIDWSRWCVALWAVVAAGITALGVFRYIRVLSLVKHLQNAPPDWQRPWDSLRKRSRWYGRGVSCQMLVSDSAGPLMIRRPRGYALVVPRAYWASLDDRQRRGVMLHELAHLQRADVWRQLIARLVATLHWFNPIAWWALRQYETAAEYACDHRVAREGQRAAAGFASALVDLVQWHGDQNSATGLGHGMGFQAMAAPPLNIRISRLLKPRSTGDSSMKRIVLALIALALILVSFFQFRLTAQEASESSVDSSAQLRVVSDDVARQLAEISSMLDHSDPTTERFASLINDASGKIAIAGYLNALSGQSREAARTEAIPRFVDHHFKVEDDGKLVVRSDSSDAMARWANQSQRVAESIEAMRRVTDDIAARLDTSTEAGGLFKRLLNDPQAPVAVLINEMDGGDVISRFLADALDQILVDQGNGTFVIVESRRKEAREQIERFEMAEKISAKLKRELPLLAAEYSTADESHRELVEYLKNPLTASLAAMEIAESVSSVPEAVEQLHQHFEEASIDTAAGLQIAEAEAWTKMKEIYARVDRAASILPRIREKLAEISDTLDADDPLTARLAEQMKADPAAVMLAAELPYAEADPGEELRALLSKVLSESQGKLSIIPDREDEITAKSRELLQICRKIRRFAVEIDEMLDRIADRQFVEQIGEAGRYAMLDEVRRFAERHRPDPIQLMREELLAQSDANRWRVREDRREVVRRLVEQSEKVRAEAANDDF